MELRQLRYVVAIAEEGGFTRAAERVRVAQPAISQQIAQLERELGAKLFDRSGRRVTLTPAGEAFLPSARATLTAADAGKDAVVALRGELAGHLALGTIPCPPEWLIRRLSLYHRRHPKVRLTLRTGDPEMLATDVVSGALSAALIGVTAERLPAGPEGQRLRATLASRHISSEPLVLAVAPGHSLAQKNQATMADLQREPIVTLTPGTGLRAVLETACSQAGFTPNIHTETDELTVLADLIAHGLGVGLLPRSAASRTQHQLVTLPLRSAPHRSMTLIWHRDRTSTLTRAFLDLTPTPQDANQNLERATKPTRDHTESQC